MFKAAEGSRPPSRPEQRPPIAPAPASARARAPRPAAPPPPPPDVPARASHRRRVVRTRGTRRGCCTLPGKHTPWANRQVRLKGYQRRALRVTAVRMSHAPQWRSTCKRVASKSLYRARSASQEADLSAEAVCVCLRACTNPSTGVQAIPPEQRCASPRGWSHCARAGRWCRFGGGQRWLQRTVPLARATPSAARGGPARRQRRRCAMRGRRSTQHASRGACTTLLVPTLLPLHECCSEDTFTPVLS